MRRRHIVLLPLSAAAVGGLAACSARPAAAPSGGSDIVTTAPSPSGVATTGAAATGSAGSTPAPTKAAPPVSLTSSLGRSAANVPFASALHVAMWGGSSAAALKSVVLEGPAGGPAGELDSTGRRWTVASLVPGASYTLVAVAEDGGRATTFRRRFTTAKATKTLSASIFPSSSGTYGVGIPVIVTFDHDVADKAAVERALKVSSSVSGVVGAWHWDSNDTVSYRPKVFWPANSRVTVSADLAGVDTGDGRWGTAADPVNFSIGNSVISKVDLASDVMTVLVNGKVARTVPVTGGQAGMHTRSGVSVISQKYADIQMDSESVGYAKGTANYYNLMVHWAMRITDSGEFLHAAPWSEYAQGRENVSHGCVGMSTDNALWLYDMTNIGDVAEVTGTDRSLEQGNGWTDWNMSWKDWLAGSALHGTAT